jgi:hypothetical protein
MRRVAYVAAVIFLFAAFGWQLWLHATRTSTTMDESGHLLAGYRHLTCGDFVINRPHPPLMKLVAALPLVGMKLRDPIGPCASTAGASVAITFAAGGQFVVMNGIDRIMIPARLAVMTFSFLLAAAVFAAAWTMFGPVEALIALAIVAFEPTLIAHGSLLTNDMTLTATLFAAVYALHLYLERPTLARLLLLGLATGLTLAAKHSGILLLPVLAVFLWPRIRAGAAVAATAVVVLFAMYGFRLEPYFAGFHFVVSASDRVMYLFDRVYPTGRWFYFPIVFTIKASLVLLLLLPFVPRAKRWILLVPPMVFLAASMSVGLNIGVRHILPIWPFLIVAGAGGLWAAAGKRTSTRIIVVALLLFHAVSALSTAPNYIAFANELWGGTDHTYRLLKDSNVELGQNVKIVREWLAEERVTECWFASYGHGLLAEAQQPCGLLPAFGWSAGRIANVVPPVISGTVLLSATTLPPRGGPEYAPIRSTQPIALLGGSVLAYRGTFRVPLLAALSHATRALQFAELGRAREALAEAQIGAQLAPHDRRIQRALAVARQAIGTTAARP